MIKRSLIKCEQIIISCTLSAFTNDRKQKMIGAAVVELVNSQASAAMPLVRRKQDFDKDSNEKVRKDGWKYRTYWRTLIRSGENAMF